MKREPELQRGPVALTIFRNIVRMIREDAKRAGLDKMTIAEIHADKSVSLAPFLGLGCN